MRVALLVAGGSLLGLVACSLLGPSDAELMGGRHDVSSGPSPDGGADSGTSGSGSSGTGDSGQPASVACSAMCTSLNIACNVRSDCQCLWNDNPCASAACLGLTSEVTIAKCNTLSCVVTATSITCSQDGVSCVCK